MSSDSGRSDAGRSDSGRSGLGVPKQRLDPSKPLPGGATAVQADDYRRAMGACLEARGYTVE